jgi:hypothetical protein
VAIFASRWLETQARILVAILAFKHASIRSLLMGGKRKASDLMGEIVCVQAGKHRINSLVFGMALPAVPVRVSAY